MSTTLAQIVAVRAGDDRPGLAFEDREWSWAEVVAAGAQRAAWLRDQVTRPADRQVHVGLLADNVPEFVFWVVACALEGAVLVGLNTSRSASEVAADVAHAEVDVVLTESRWHHLAPTGPRVVDLDAAGYAEALVPYAGAALPTARPDVDDIAFLLFSSGSTGTPKAVVVGQGRMARLAPVLTERIALRADETTYLCMPLFHGNALMMNLVPAVVVGARVGLARRFSASGFGPDVHRFGAAYVNYVGRALSYVLASPTDPRDASSTLRLAFGTEASEADAERFARRFGAEVREGYGMSEGVFRINRTPETPPGSLGLPPDGVDLRILDEATGAECPRAEFDGHGRLTNPEAVGQFVAVGAAASFEGYWKNPGATAERVRGEDFWSGDLGYRDADGWFWFAGRSSDWLRVDSENFAAAQVERILTRHPQVAAAPVVAVPDPATGDQVLAALELHPGTDPEEFAAGWGAWLDAQPDLGAKWWPRFVRLVEAVPLTGSGKVDKQPLRRTQWAGEEPVLLREGRTAGYRWLLEEDRDRMRAEFAAHGRAALAP